MLQDPTTSILDGVVHRAAFLALLRGFAFMAGEQPTLVLQAFFDGVAVCFTTMAGEQFCCFEAVATERLVEVQARVIREAGLGRSSVDAISSGGVLMTSVLRRKPSATLSETGNPCRFIGMSKNMYVHMR